MIKKVDPRFLSVCPVVYVKWYHNIMKVTMGLNQLNLNYKWLSFLLEVGVEKNKLICLDIDVSESLIQALFVDKME